MEFYYERYGIAQCSRFCSRKSLLNIHVLFKANLNLAIQFQLVGVSFFFHTN